MKPMVSICCITYNHEKYIAEALDSLLMQDTSFPIEIIVHDDASTDKTSEILRGYEKRYPNIIKPIYQSENQYSKGKKVTFECVIPYVSGNYIAFCEGDDYWLDKKKLQKQIDFLIQHDDYSGCFHGVEVVDINRKSLGVFRGPVGNRNKDYRMKDNIRGGFIHVSSLVMSSKVLDEGIPKWALNSRHGDYALAIIISANGNVHFIDEVMSSYRIGVENSVMTKLRDNRTKENEINYYNQRMNTLIEANSFYNYKFDEDIKAVIYESEIKVIIMKNDFRKLFNKKYKDYFSEKGLLNIIKLILSMKTPEIAKRIILIRKAIRGSRKI